MSIGPVIREGVHSFFFLCTNFHSMRALEKHQNWFLMTQTNHKKVFELLVPQSENNFSFCNLLLYSDPSYANFYALSFVSLAYPFFCELRPSSRQAQNKALATSG